MTQKKKNIFKPVALVVLAVLATAAVYVLSTAFRTYGGDEATRIYIPAGATPEAVTDSLAGKLGKQYASAVMRMCRGQGGHAEEAHGSYVVEPGTSALRLSRRLVRRRQSPVRITFNNVRTLAQLADRIASRMEFGSDGFLAACDSILPTYNFRPLQYPAAFIPDTYEAYWTDSPQKIVEKLAATRNDFWNDRRRARAKELGLTPVGVATIASIVEEETAKADERPKVARLYLNRLAAGMPLQADPTVKFATGNFSLRRLNATHLKTPSPYNTYLNKGLPPGPIRIAERKTLEAVLDAPPHDYLYMCAREDFSGYHNFARSFSDHKRNAARYRDELNRRGIR